MLAWLQDYWAWYQPLLLLGGGYAVGQILALLPFLGLNGLGRQCGLAGLVVGAAVWGLNTILHKLSIIPAEQSFWLLALIVLCVTTIALVGPRAWTTSPPATPLPTQAAPPPQPVAPPVQQTTGTGSPLQTGQNHSIHYHAPVNFGAPPEAIQDLREGQKAAETAAAGRHDVLLEEQRQLSGRMMDALMQRFGREGLGELGREKMLLLAQSLTADAVTNLDHAHAELKPVIEAYMEAKTRPAFVRNQGDFLPAVLERIARFNEADDFDAGRREVDAALADLARQSGKRHAAERRQREELMEAGIRQDTIRTDAEGVARWEEALVTLRHTAKRPTWTAPYRQRWNDYYKQGDEGGNNFALLVAIAMGRRMLVTAGPRDDRVAAMGNLGITLAVLGGREPGTARLEEAIETHRAVLAEHTRARAPLDWATTQNNLGNALSALGARESGTALLEEAVAAYRAALQERTRGRVPLEWATTQNNLGNALLRLGERESGTARLEEAVAAYRAALQERKRDRVPLDWARTQTNLGTALRTLGERESGTARLEEAVAAYRAALEERTRDRVPLNWATSYGNQGVALSLLGARLGDRAKAEAGLQQIIAAFETMRDGGHAVFAKYYEAQIPIARAALAGIGDKGSP